MVGRDLPIRVLEVNVGLRRYSYYYTYFTYCSVILLHVLLLRVSPHSTMSITAHFTPTKRASALFFVPRSLRPHTLVLKKKEKKHASALFFVPRSLRPHTLVASVFSY